jgi:hypothetical protein
MPRLTRIDIPGAAKESATPRKRGYFHVMQVRHGGEQDDWQPAPKAMRNLMEHVHKVTGMDVMLEPGKLRLDSSEVVNTKFFYMHGRKDFRISADLAPLRFTLTNGGLLLADACCGDAAFDKAFRKFAQELFPKEKLVLLSTDPMNRDPLYTGEGEALSRSTIKCRTKASGPMGSMEPHLEGIMLAGRWVVLYSKYDLGCALERNTAADCRGYDYASALRIATAAVLYNARP